MSFFSTTTCRVRGTAAAVDVRSASASRKPERVRPRGPPTPEGGRRARAALSRPGAPRSRETREAAGGRERVVDARVYPLTDRRHDLSGRPPQSFPPPPPPRRTTTATGKKTARSNRQSRGEPGARATRPPSRRTGRARPDARRGLAEFPVCDPQTGVARDPWVTEAAMCVR